MKKYAFILSSLVTKLSFLLLLLSSINAEGQTVSITPASPTAVYNCIPFGSNTFYGFSGFIYRNVPAFTISPGKTIRFDLGALNDVAIRRNIYFSAANINPGPYTGIPQNVMATGWVQLVPESQTPLNSLGNTTSGDYELTYTSTGTFTFPGGGLIIGFGGNPPATYTDAGCEQVLVATTSADVSGNFYARFYSQPHLTTGVLDNGGGDNSALGGFIVETGCAAPAFTSCPANITTTTAATSCGAVVNYNVTTSGTAPITYSHVFSGATTGSGSNTGSGATFNKGVTSVTVTATNACGTVTCNFTVTVSDATNPSITCPPNITVSNDQGNCSAVVNYTEPAASDNCGACNVTSLSGYTYLGQHNGHSYFVSNGTGLWGSFNTQAQSLGGHLATVTTAGEGAFISNHTSVRAWIGLSDQQTEGVYRWVTGEPFVYSPWCANEPNNGGSTGNEDFVLMNWCSGGGWNDGDNNTPLQAIIEFDCGLQRTAGPPSGSAFPVGNTTVSYTATDGAGNTSNCSFTVTVNDTEPPTITCPPSVTVDCQASTGPGGSNGTATATDNCTPVAEIIITYIDYVNNGSCGVNQTIQRTWTARDGARNSSSCVQVINVEDNTGPVLTCPPTATVACDGDITPAATGTATAQDNCSGVRYVIYSDGTPTAGNCPGNYSFIRTWRALDNCLNPSSCTQTINVQDMAAPTLAGTAYAGTTGTNACKANAAAAAPFSASNAVQGYSDNCSSPVSATLTNTAVTGTDCSWTVSYTFDVKDACGNTLNGQTYSNTGSDQTAPSGTQYGGRTGINACAANAVAAAPFDAAAAAGGYTDNCGGPVTATLTGTTVAGTDCAWSVTYMYTVSDACGNVLGGQSYTNTGSDQTPPALTGTRYGGTSANNVCLANAATAAPFSASDAVQGYSDNCGGAVTATLTGTNVTGTDCSWTVTYTYEVKDGCGNTLSGQTYSNTGRDQTAPTGTQYGGRTGINACAANAIAAAPFDAAAAAGGYTDNCGGPVTATHTGTTVAGTNCAWSVTYMYSVSDACGNVLGGQSYTNTGSDQTPPALTGTPYGGTSGTDACKAAAATAAPFSPTNAVQGYSDNCGGSVSATLNNTQVTGTDCNWTVTYTYSVKDACGNTLANRSYANTGGDKTPPTAACKNITVTLVNGAVSITPADVNNGSADNCGAPVTTSISKSSFNCSNLGNNTVILTVTDACQNSSTCTATVNVVGAQPSCTISSAKTAGSYNDGNSAHVYLGYGDGKVVLTVNPTGGNSFTYSWTGPNLSCYNCPNPTFTATAGGNYTFTATVTNDYGCTTTCSITICVLDIRVPGQSGKVYICHVPQGNPANAQTLSVSSNAVPAHLNNHGGDRLGPCDQSCGNSLSRMSGNGSVIGEAVRVYPNPNNGSFTVELPYIDGVASINVTDVAGKIIEHRTVRDGDGHRLQFMLTDVAKGMYFVEV